MTPCRPDDGRCQGWRPEQNSQAVEAVNALKQPKTPIGQQGKTHHAQAGGNRIHQHHGAVEPEPPIGEFAAQVVQKIGFMGRMMHGGIIA